MKWFEVMAELHARWPALLRKLAKDRPDTQDRKNRAPSKLQKDTLVAVAAGEKEGFEEGHEYAIRKGEYMTRWAYRLGTARSKANRAVANFPDEPMQ